MKIFRDIPLPPNIPDELPGQSIESMAALIGLLNPGLNLLSPPGLPLGQASRQTGQFAVSPGNLLKLISAVSSHSREPFLRLLERHGYASLFRPFVDPGKFVESQREVDLGKARARFLQLPRNYERLCDKNTRYCQECAAESIEKRGFAYAKCNHQVAVVGFCAEHGKRLSYLAANAAEHLSAFPGLLIPHPHADWRASLTEIPIFKDSNAWRAVSNWVAIALEGGVPYASFQTRRACLSAATQSSSDLQNAPNRLELRLQPILNHAYDEATISRALASIGQPVNADWTNTLARDINSATNPVPWLLCLSAVFQTVGEYKCALEAFQFKPGLKSPSFPPPRSMHIETPIGVIRDLYRLSDLEFTRKRGVGQGLLRTWKAGIPQFAKRRQRFQRWRLGLQHRRNLNRYVDESQQPTRSGLSRCYPATYNWLLQNNRPLLECVIPLSSPPTDLSDE